MSEIRVDTFLKLPDLTPEMVLKLAKERPFSKFVSFPIDMEIAGRVFREDVIMEVEDATSKQTQRGEA